MKRRASGKRLGLIRFDAVYDFAYDWEHGTTGRQVEATAQIFDGKVGRYVFMSSVAAYGDGLNHHEGDALAPDDHPNPYARNKAMSERALFRLHQRTGFPIVTLRPPFVYGPGNPFYREAFFWDRFRAGRPVILPSEGHRLMQFIYIQDLVDLAIRVVENRNTIGHAFNASNARADYTARITPRSGAGSGRARAGTGLDPERPDPSRRRQGDGKREAVLWGIFRCSCYYANHYKGSTNAHV